MGGERFTFSFRDETLTAELEEPAAAARASAILLAHGAGFHIDSPWMAEVARGLVAHGFAVMRFNYPYRERALREGRARPPDRTAVLEEAHAAALAELARRAGTRRILLAGKSLGGRISTLIAAKGERAAGLVLFGSPLHPPGKPERPRSEHFPAICQPALFLQGTRDEFADLGLLQAALERYGGRATLEVVVGADHGFGVPKKLGTSSADVRASLLERVARWERETFPD
jgi:predicted alpha/beta-hydrolase family hydrolase